jgi:branched-chain amino acid transport system substrate-binding protein
MSHRHMSRRGKSAAFLIALAAVFTLILSACTSSSTSSGFSAAASGGGSAAAAGGPNTPSASSVSTADPVVVGIMYTDNNPLGTSPEIKGAALAAQQYINAHGGIGGRALKVVPCNGANNAQNDVQCATEFADDGAITVQGLDAVWGSIGPAILQKSDVVNQTEPFAGPEFDNPNAYPWLGMNVTGGAVLAAYVKQQHASAACMYIDVAALAQACTTEFEQHLGESIPLVPIAVSANDMSQYVARLAQLHPEYVYLSTDPNRSIAIMQAASQIGYDPHWMMIQADAEPVFFKNLGSLAKGTVFFSDLELSDNTTDPDTAIFNEAMKEYAPSILIDGQSVMTFSDLMTLKRLGDQQGGDKMIRADLSGLLAKIHGIKQFMGPVLNYATYLPGHPHDVHAGAYVTMWNGQTYQPLGYYLDS